MLHLSTLTSKFREIINNKTIPQAHLDSAVTSMILSNKHKYLGKELPNKETRVGVANTNTMDSVLTQQLQVSPELPAEAQKGHGFNEMNCTLISAPVLCDPDCTVVFNKGNVQVFNDNKIIIEGPRDMETNLWLMSHEFKNNNNNNTKPNKKPLVIQLKYTANSEYQQK